MNLKERQYIINSIYHAKSGHPGGALSAVDMIAYLFKHVMRYDKNNMQDIRRDRFVLSKGHCAPALYAVAAEVGILDYKKINSLRKLNSELQGHTHRGSTPWVEASTGSLGQGFSFAIGEALGFRHQDIGNKVFVMIGDGEVQEGQIWEGAMFAAHHKLDNLCVILDYNKMQSDDLNENIMGLEPLKEKWQAFNWHVIEIDGHKESEMEVAFNEEKTIDGKPTLIIAHTIKGKGISYMEGIPTWHGSVKLSDEDCGQALQELGCSELEVKELMHV